MWPIKMIHSLVEIVDRMEQQVNTVILTKQTMPLIKHRVKNKKN